ncbi:hypothetical protein M2267_002850 [Ensifer sp. KUDG1]
MSLVAPQVPAVDVLLNIGSIIASWLVPSDPRDQQIGDNVP